MWASDSREVFYRGPEHVMAVRLADGPRITIVSRDTLFRDSYNTNPLRSDYDVFPGGQEFLFIRDRREEDARTRLVVLMNWHLRSRAREDSER